MKAKCPVGRHLNGVSCVRDAQILLHNSVRVSDGVASVASEEDQVDYTADRSKCDGRRRMNRDLCERKIVLNNFIMYCSL